MASLMLKTLLSILEKGSHAYMNFIASLLSNMSPQDTPSILQHCTINSVLTLSVDPLPYSSALSSALNCCPPSVSEHRIDAAHSLAEETLLYTELS